jgi:hypothetical protein
VVHGKIVSNTVAEMMPARVLMMLPPGEGPWVVNPLGVAPRRGTDKFRLMVNMRYFD